ncbi:MAG: inorganic phosphate transporter [Nitrospirae bacterium]|nr:inorganic phosphate transporter [Nitrospirota bacterium]
MPETIIFIIIIALLFDMSNGMHDTANAIATVVSTRVLSPVQAVLMAATLNILGAFISTHVAKTIGIGLVDPAGINSAVIMSALVAGFIWNIAMIRLGLPVSSSHALIGSLIGAAFSHGGLTVLNFRGLSDIFISLLISPVLALIFGYLLMKLILIIFGRFSPSGLNKNFGILQIFSSAFMAFSHGSNDAQKVMGIITLTLFSSGVIHSAEVPFWVILICALAMGFGTALGGWKVIKTLGVSMLKLEPIHGFAAETAATTVILGASYFGMPVSTTNVISCTIMGVGATKRLSAVRWGVARKILFAWIFTFPCCILMAYFFYKFISIFIK